MIGKPSPSQFLKAYLKTPIYNGSRITREIRSNGLNGAPESMGLSSTKKQSHIRKIKAYGFQYLADRNLLSQIWRWSATSDGKLIAESNIHTRLNLWTSPTIVTVTRNKVIGHA